MALLQISEPGASPEPHTRRYAVGIDLGTTHSLVAAVRSGVPECLPDRDGEVILPSAVRYLPDGTTRVGREALAGAVSDPTNTIVSVKRLMGRGLADVSKAGRLAYDFVDGEGMVRVRTAAGVKSPVEISAEILATLRQRAEDTFEADLYGAVITVPAYFDDAQRPATKDAAGASVEQAVTRADLEAIARPFVDRTMVAVRQAVRDAKVDKSAIDGIVLVGGSTRMPLVRRLVHDFFGRQPLTNLDPDQVVAL